MYFTYRLLGVPLNRYLRIIASNFYQKANSCVLVLPTFYITRAVIQSILMTVYVEDTVGIHVVDGSATASRYSSFGR